MPRLCQRTTTVEWCLNTRKDIWMHAHLVIHNISILKIDYVYLWKTKWRVGRRAKCHDFKMKFLRSFLRYLKSHCYHRTTYVIFSRTFFVSNSIIRSRILWKDNHSETYVKIKIFKTHIIHILIFSQEFLNLVVVTLLSIRNERGKHSVCYLLCVCDSFSYVLIISVCKELPFGGGNAEYDERYCNLLWLSSSSRLISLAVTS